MKHGRSLLPVHLAIPPVESRGRLLLVVLFCVFVIVGLVLGWRLGELPYPLVDLGDDEGLWRVATVAILTYIFLAALPFVPAAEIGLSLMLLFGPRIAVLVYLGTVLALALAYLIGRAVPPRASAAVFRCVGMEKARNLVLQMAALDTPTRVELFLARAPGRVVPTLLRHRYLALAVALNLPGNTLLGGGGGIALSAGISGLYPISAYLGIVAVAVAPVPLLFALSALWL